MRTSSKPLLPPVYFLASIIVIIGLGMLLAAAKILSFPWTMAGVIPIAAGVALILVQTTK